jgi:carboxyl-terminal processing protease
MIKKRRVRREAEPTLKEQKPLSTRTLGIIVALTAIVGVLAGTQVDRIYTYVAPLFGIKTYAGEIDLSSLQSTYKNLKANFDGKLDDQDLIDGANSGLVNAAGDEYTVYMNSKEATAFADELSGKIGGGIGAEVSIRNEKITIIRTLKGNPAEKAGLQAGDVVLSINDESTDGKTVEEAVTQIRGKEGTTVKLSIQRGTEIKEFTVTRAIVSNPSVTSSIDGSVGTLTIGRFDEETGDLARAVAQDFRSKGVTSVVLDLRGNGGGFVTAAQDVAGLWLDNKLILIEKSNDQVLDRVKTGSNALLAGLPTVVLVNSSSASASEIVAGALQEYKVATLVGEKTFGKGSVQKLIDLPQGSQLKVTIAKWYTPLGKNINKEGVTPDITVELTQADVDAGKDPQVTAALKELSQ